MSGRVLVSVTLLLLAGCTTSRSTDGSSSVSTSPTSTTSPASSTSSSTTAPATTAPATTAPPSTAPATTSPTTVPPTKPATTAPPTTAPDPRCRTADLALTLGAGDAGAGQLFQPLVFTNTGSRSCTLQGFPDVTLLDGGGATIGDPAGREATTPPVNITLDPGEVASALLRTTNGPIGGPCLPPSTRISVVLPGDSDDLTVAAVYTACGGFTVRAFVPGPDGI